MSHTRRPQTRFIVLHCSATRPNQAVEAADIRRWHLARGWSDIGYHYVITRDGRVQKGRVPDDTIGAHVEGHNSDTLGICLVGGLNAATGRPENNFTEQQWAALRQLVASLLPRYPGVEICGHRDLSPDRNGDGVVTPNEWLKACPCFDARAWARANGFPPMRANRNPLARSRTVAGAVTASAGGVATLAAPLQEALGKAQEGLGAISAGTWIGIAIGLVVLVGAGLALYARWDDAGRPLPWRPSRRGLSAFGLHEPPRPSKPQSEAGSDGA